MRCVNPSFWKSKKVFLTGHTGFKGAWLSLWLSSMGAKVTGFSLSPKTFPNLYEVLGINRLIISSVIGDITDLGCLQKAMNASDPDIVIHMAAQPLVRYSYSHPVETYATNVLGTVHLLEATRLNKSIRATIIITTDKCYENKEWVWSYRENESMGGVDPYSSSKGCAELVTSAYRESFFSVKSFHEHQNAIASARAGNVIGGGDWSNDRLVPDAIMAFERDVPLIIRNPNATRPWQHVLEPLSGYLVLAESLYEKGPDYVGAWNFGPEDKDVKTVKDVIDLISEGWGSNSNWQKGSSDNLHEAQLLKLDCSKANFYLDWRSKWSVNKAIEKILDWQRAYKSKIDMQMFSLSQISSYCES